MRKPLGVLLCLALSSCAQNPATGGHMFSLVGEQGEREIGQATANDALKKYGLYRPASKATKYVTQLCQTMFAVTEIAQQPLSCILLDDDTFNAWATPGYINVYRGLLPYVNSEAELAAVLGHESGHLSARHVAQGATASMLAGMAVTAVGLVVAARTQNSGAAETAMQVGSLAAGVAVAKYGRDYETQADSLAQRYLPRAGYDPRASVSMVRGMQAYEAYAHQLAIALKGDKADQETLYGQLTSSHPATPERLAAAIKGAGEPDGAVHLPAGVSPATPPDDPNGRRRFLEAMDGLAVGPQRAWGMAGRGYVAVPSATTVVRMPDGFVTQYVQGAEKPERGVWKGRHPETDVTFTLTVVPLRAGLNIAQAMQDLMPEIKSDSLQRLALKDGTEAYTGVASPLLSRNVVRLVGIPSPETNNAVIFGYTFNDDAQRQREEKVLMDAAARSEVLGREAMRRWRPLELAVRTVNTGDTVARLAEKLPAGALREEWFRALNALPPGEEVRLGQKYKTVIDPNL